MPEELTAWLQGYGRGVELSWQLFTVGVELWSKFFTLTALRTKHSSS
jgi:hypothetical protein